MTTINQAIQSPSAPTTANAWQPDELEHVYCDFCGPQPSRELTVRADGMRVVQCDRCGLTWLNPRPKPELISRFYEKEYFSKSGGGASIGYGDYVIEANRRARLSDAEEKLALLKPFYLPAVSRCLEIGAATGEFCHVLHQQGARIVGYDLSEFAIEEARRSYPVVDFRVGNIEAVRHDHMYDAIFAFELIEHVLSPSAFLQRAGTLLKANGILVLSTPNLDCGRAAGWDRWMGFQISFEHLYFFTPDTLARLGGRHGLHLESWFTGLGDGVLLAQQSNPSGSSGRTVIRGTLAKLGLLEFVRASRRLWRQDAVSPRYSPGGNQHNLLAVFKKQESSSVDSKERAACAS